MLDLFLPAAGGDPCPAPRCPVSCVGPVPRQPQEPYGASVRGSGSAAPRCVAAAGAAGSGCVTRSLLGREQTAAEKPWLCLASHCLRSGATGCRPHPCPGWEQVGRTGMRGSRLWMSPDTARLRGNNPVPTAGRGVLLPGRRQSRSPGWPAEQRAGGTPQPHGLSVPLSAAARRGPPPADNGKGREAFPTPGLRNRLLWPVTPAVTWRLRLKLPRWPGH